jgi:hypothetical protein
MTDLVMQFERESTNYPCGLCGEGTCAETGPRLAMAATLVPVCRECGKKHAPPLLALINLAEAAQHVGRIGRHMISPPLPVLLDLARAAEDYLHTTPDGQKQAS